MAESRASHRYAKALLELAIEQGVLEQVNEDMASLVKVCNENREFELMLKSPIVPHYKKLSILEAVFKGKIHSISFSMFEIITQKNREAILKDIAISFGDLFNIHHNIQVAELITTFEIDEQTRNKFKKIVEETTGKKVDLREKIDRSLIGGYVLKIADQQIDESVKNKLRKIKMDLFQN